MTAIQHDSTGAPDETVFSLRIGIGDNKDIQQFFQDTTADDLPQFIDKCFWSPHFWAMGSIGLKPQPVTVPLRRSESAKRQRPTRRPWRRFDHGKRQQILVG